MYTRDQIAYMLQEQLFKASDFPREHINVGGDSYSRASIGKPKSDSFTATMSISRSPTMSNPNTEYDSVSIAITQEYICENPDGWAERIIGKLREQMVFQKEEPERLENWAKCLGS